MTSGTSTNGVDRYLSCLVDGLAAYSHICLHWIRLVSNAPFLFHTIETAGHYTQATVPLPQRSGEIIGEYFWADKYNELVYGFVSSLFENKQHIVIHIHTLNLIDLAECIKRHLPARIITHVHCIAWKNYYNSSMPKFNDLYRAYYLAEGSCDYKRFVTSPSEKRSYDHADRVIAVTACAKEFLNKVMRVPEDKISVISNGMEDCCGQVVCSSLSEPVECLFVGSVVPGKGIFYILEALRFVQQEGYSVLLHIAGLAYPKELEAISSKYADIPVNLLGPVPFSVLKEYYRRCHIGLIASLQEQFSYVAVEMSMFGLPVITTAVDGLDEIFTDEVNALKVQTKYNRAEGVRVDVVQMKEKIVDLIRNEGKRRSLSSNVRKLYEERLTAKRMVSEVVKLYNEFYMK